MAKRILSIAVLLAFVNYIVGCTSQATIAQGEIIASTKITKAVLLSGEAIVFQTSGGHFKVCKNAVVGTTVSGKTVGFDENVIKEVRISKPEIRSVKDVKDQKIAEIVLEDGLLIQFTSQEGHYNETKGTVDGPIESGSVRKTAVKRIKEIRVSSPTTVQKSELMNSKDMISEIVISPFNNDTKFAVTFDDRGGQVKNSYPVIEGVSDEGQFRSVPLNQIAYVESFKLDGGKTILTMAILALLLYVIVAAISYEPKTTTTTSGGSSCPFIYSFDGEHYRLDAEPLGGSICKLFQKTDYSCLDYIKPINGKYKLLVQNENEETQYLDQLRLVLADHPIGTKVMYDQSGNIHLIKNASGPVAALDERGTDISKLIRQQDFISWQTKLFEDTLVKRPNFRHQLTFKFLKPAQAQSARLLINAGTDVWGSHMTREMLRLRGNKVDEWLEDINARGPSLQKLIQFNEREELYFLKIMVKEGDTWIQQGFVPGGGPMVYEDRVYPIDLSRVQGDTVTIRLNPPEGYWAIDYAGMSYDNDEFASTTEIPIASVESQNGEKIQSQLNEKDQSYWVMPNTGDNFTASFDAPRLNAGLERSVFLKTSGFYEIHLSKNQPEQTELIQKLSDTPGAIVEYSIDEFIKWRTQLLGATK